MGMSAHNQTSYHVQEMRLEKLRLDLIALLKLSEVDSQQGLARQQSVDIIELTAYSHSLSQNTDLLTQLENPNCKRVLATIVGGLDASALKRLQSKRLGDYVECLWLVLIQLDQQSQLHAHNLQVFSKKQLKRFNLLRQKSEGKKGRQTLGEFDFLLSNKRIDSQHKLHLEVAIKFYLNTRHLYDSEKVAQQLQAQTLSPASFLQGPSSVDNLQKKFSHLINKQLKLSNELEAQLLLKQINIHLIRPQASIKAYLFDHFQNLEKQAPLQIQLSHLKSLPLLWCYIDELDEFLHEVSEKLKAAKPSTELSTKPSTNICYLSKPHWLATEHLSDEFEAIKPSVIETIMHAKDSPQLFALYTDKIPRNKSEPALIQETLRFFVAPRVWPQHRLC